MEMTRPTNSFATGEPADALAICMAGFTFAYPRSDRPVLDGVDFRVDRGEFVLLGGDTGSGKTTLLRCLKPEITPVGTKSGVARAAGAIGYVAQNPETQIVCDSVWHEMAFGLENAGVDPDDMRLRVAEVAYFFGMEPWFDASVNELSGGQKQLLNLAAVLALRPDVLLLDEPTAQLDPLAARDFAHALFRVNRELGLTVVVATHGARWLQHYATRQVRLEGGKVVEATMKVDVTATPAPASPDSCISASAQGTGGSSEIAVSLHEVFATYSRSAKPVLRGISLDIGRGKIHALIGGNGCGKTTILRVMAGVMEPYRGKVRRAKLTQGYLPQDPHALFMADTVEEELQLWQATSAHPYTDADIAEALARFGLEDTLQQHPYDLSGGQMQLLALAKLLLVKPDLYLLDEPSKGLDARSERLFADALRAEAARGATVILATHDMALVRDLCTAVSFVFDGQVAATMPPEAFFAKNLFFRPFLGDDGAAGEGER